MIKVNQDTLNREARGRISEIYFYNSFKNMCFRYIKEPSHRDGSFKYPKHIFE